MTYAGFQTLRTQAQALRREELTRIASATAIKWQTQLAPPRRHAPHPCQSPAPTHP